MKPGIEISTFGTLPDGRKVRLYTITNRAGLVAKVIEYGTILTEMHVPDRGGDLRDVVLGFDELEGYLGVHPYFGATVGRVANRIAGAEFMLEGKHFRLAANNGPNALHGGLEGFDKKLWRSEQVGDREVKFGYRSPDGEEGYPGNLDVEITMTLTDDNELSIDYVAHTDRSTIINLTNHSYFNLSSRPDVLDHEMMISAAHYTPSDAASVPTGEVRAVKGTPMDFTTPQRIGARFGELKGEQPGYDTNYVINRAGKGLALAARVFDPETGRGMEVHTTQPGMQFYTANFFDGSLVGKRGIAYPKHAGFCLETQHYPDSIHHHDFPSVILRPGQTYHHTTVHKFISR